MHCRTRIQINIIFFYCASPRFLYKVDSALAASLYQYSNIDSDEQLMSVANEIYTISVSLDFPTFP